MPAVRKKTNATVAIAPPNILTEPFRIRGTAPYVQNKFTQRAREEMHSKQAQGSQSKKGVARKPKDFQECFQQAQHVAHDSATCTMAKEKSCKCPRGIPAPSFRNALISACRLVGFQMTRAKLAVFIEADAIDHEDGTPLVTFTVGEPEYTEMAVRNESGVADLRARPMWREGWEAVVRVRYDGDQFSLSDVKNLLARAGLQVGIGAGRHDSKSSAGMGWGTFEIVEEKKKAA